MVPMGPKNRPICQVGPKNRPNQPQPSIRPTMPKWYKSQKKSLFPKKEQDHVV
jgi:hypothetical protein